MKPYNQLTEEDKQSIVDAYFDNIAFSKLPEYLDISQRAVARVLKDKGVNTRLKNRYTLDRDYFESIDTEQKAYWLGFLYADGYVGDEKFNNVVLGLIDTDKSHLDMFVEHISFTGNVRLAGRGGYKGSRERYVVNFSSKKMASDLRKLGLYPGKSTTMSSFPDIPQSLIRHFIRGYFDGDGSVYTARSTSYHKGKMYEYRKPVVSIIATRDFAEEIAINLPYKHRIRQSKSPDMVYIEYYGVSDFPLMYDELYNDATVYLQRKYDKFNDILAPLESNLH